MAKLLDSIIQIDNEEYSITAEKVAHSLTINTGSTTIEFDGSEDKEITIEATGGGGDADSAETANKIQVNMDNGIKEYATITISSDEPRNGNSGDIWFKYIN